MPKHNLRELIEYDDRNSIPKVVVNQPGYRVVLLNIREGQHIPEHTTKEMVTVYAIRGHITFYEDNVPVVLRAGEVLCLDGGIPHRAEAHEDSSLLVIAAGNNASSEIEQLDLRRVPHPQRHPMVFAKFDALAMDEAFELINDHDPVPLNRQLDMMRPGQVEWRYITRGPEIFHIQIRRIAPPSGSEVSLTARPETQLQGIRSA